MYKYHSGKSCDYGQAGSFKCFEYLEKLLCWMFHNISSANKEKILWIRKNNYIIFWLWNVYYYSILSGKNKYYAEEIYIHKYTYDCKLKTFREMLLTTLEPYQHDVIDVIWRLPVWNIKIRRYLASCTLQFWYNLTKISFQGNHFNYLCLFL